MTSTSAERTVSTAAKKSGGSRRAARELVVRSLYSRLCGGRPDANLQDYLSRRADSDWTYQVLTELPPRTAELDRTISALSSRAMREIDSTELCILRLACYELAHCPETPWKVVVNEAVRLTKMYCAEDSYRFVNGLAEQLAKQLRPEAEVKDKAAKID